MSIVTRCLGAVLLFWALAKHPYGYYTVLRWTTCAAAAYSSYLAVQQAKARWAWVLGITALLFNPLVPVHLHRDLWTPIDLVAAVVLLISIGGVRETAGPAPPHNGKEPPTQ